MTGTILVSSEYAYVLFDSGVSHTFVSTKFARKHDISIEPIDVDLCMDTLIGSTLIVNHTCKSYRVVIEDRELIADLMVLDMHDFDVILGMDWLSGYHASINCHEKKFNFHIPGQLEFSFIRV